MSNTEKINDSELTQFLKEAAAEMTRRRDEKDDIRDALEYLEKISGGKFEAKAAPAKKDGIMLVTSVGQSNFLDPKLRLKIDAEGNVYLNLPGHGELVPGWDSQYQVALGKGIAAESLLQHGRMKALNTNSWLKMSAAEALTHLTRQAVLKGQVRAVDDAPANNMQQMIASVVMATLAQPETYARDLAEGLTFLAEHSNGVLQVTQKRFDDSSSISLTLIAAAPHAPFQFWTRVDNDGKFAQLGDCSLSLQTYSALEKESIAAAIIDAAKQAVFRGKVAFDTEATAGTWAQQAALTGIRFALEEQQLARDAAKPVAAALELIKQRSNGAYGFREAPPSNDGSVNYWVGGDKQINITVTAAGKMILSDAPEKSYNTENPAEIAAALRGLARAAVFKATPNVRGM